MRQQSRLNRRQSKKFVERRQLRLAFRVFIIIIAIVAAGYGLSRLSFAGFMAIDSVEVRGNRALAETDIESVVRRELSGKYWGLFSRENSLLYPRKSIVAGLLDFSPEIETASVERAGWNGLQVTLKEKEPVAVICPELPDFRGGRMSNENLSSCYMVDITGLAFARATTTLSSTSRYFIPSLAEATSSDDLVGEIIIDPIRLRDLGSFYAGLSAHGISVQAFMVKANDEYEAYIAGRETDEGGSSVLYFVDSRNLDLALSNLLSFLGGMKIKGLGRASDYEYIDLRYGSNVFYRVIEKP